MNVRFLFLLSATIVFFANPAAALPVFPGAVGFGTQTPAGRGGVVLFVTNLNDDGPGSLRAAVTAAGPRTVLFRVDGVIELKSHLFITEPFLTLAGQSAPGAGITIKDFGVTVTTHDVLIQHLRIRPGNEGAVEPTHNDAINIFGPGDDGSSDAYNVVLDHLSVSWGEDELISTWFGPRDITVSNCIISEALDKSRHGKGSHSAGLLVGSQSDRVSVVGNVFAHNSFRNPLFIGGGTHEAVNNFIYNWGDLGTEAVNNAPQMSLNIRHNAYKKGPSSIIPHPLLINPHEDKGQLKIFAEGNTVPLTSGFNGAAPVKDHLAPVAFDTPLSTAARAEIPWTTVGASRPKRDAIDERVLRDIVDGTGRIIDSPAEVGGYGPRHAPATPPPDSDNDGLPDVWESGRAVDPAADDDGDGYTNLEDYLNSLL